MFKENYVFETNINSAWIVSQYANEYNPLHNHTGCELSGVIYLKTPNVKGRRNIRSKKGKQESDGDISLFTILHLNVMKTSLKKVWYRSHQSQV